MVRVPTRSLALDPAECKNTVGQPGGRTTRPGPLEGTGPRCCSRGSGAANRVGLRTLLALDDLEADPLALVEALVAVHLDGRVVDEDVLTAVDGDEAEALLGVEPLHGAKCHVCSHVRACGRPLPVEGPGSRSSARRTRTWNSNRAERYRNWWCRSRGMRTTPPVVWYRVSWPLLVS